MSGYQGECDFTFSVERFKDADGRLYSEDDVDLPEDGIELLSITLYVHGTAYYIPARLGADPDDSYPSEGEDDIVSVVDKDGNDWFEMLTSHEIQDISEKISDKVCENQTGFRTLFN